MLRYEIYNNLTINRLKTFNHFATIPSISIKEIYTDSDDMKSLNDDITKAIQSQEIQNGSSSVSVFTAWDLGDVRNAVQNNLEGEPGKRKAILYLTSLVEDCQNQIDGRKRSEVY